MRRLLKKKSHKKQHLCYRDVFNKYYRKSTSYQKELPGPEGAINRNSLHFKVFPRRVKTSPLLDGKRRSEREESISRLLPQASISRAALWAWAWCQQVESSPARLTSPGVRALSSLQGWSVRIKFLFSLWVSLFREQPFHSEDSVGVSGPFLLSCFLSRSRGYPTHFYLTKSRNWPSSALFMSWEWMLPMQYVKQNLCVCFNCYKIVGKVCVLVSAGEEPYLLQEQFSKGGKRTHTFIWGFQFFIHFFHLISKHKIWFFSEYTGIKCPFFYMK